MGDFRWACDFFGVLGVLGESSFGVLRTVRLGVIRLAANFGFLARMLLERGDVGEPLTDPDAIIVG